MNNNINQRRELFENIGNNQGNSEFINNNDNTDQGLFRNVNNNNQNRGLLEDNQSEGLFCNNLNNKGDNQERALFENCSNNKVKACLKIVTRIKMIKDYLILIITTPIIINLLLIIKEKVYLEIILFPLIIFQTTILIIQLMFLIHYS